MNIAFQRIKGFYFMIKQYIKLCIKGAISKQYDLILDPNTKFKRIFEIKKWFKPKAFWLFVIEKNN